MLDLPAQQSHGRRVNARVIRLGNCTAVVRLPVSGCVDFKRRRQMSFALGSIGCCQAQVFVGSCEQPQRFTVNTAFVAERCELLVGAPHCTAARQRQALQLAQSILVRPVGQRLLDCVISEQWLSHPQQLFRFAHRVLRLRCHLPGSGRSCCRPGCSLEPVAEVGQCTEPLSGSRPPRRFVRIGQFVPGNGPRSLLLEKPSGQRFNLALLAKVNAVPDVPLVSGHFAIFVFASWVGHWADLVGLTDLQLFNIGMFSPSNRPYFPQLGRKQATARLASGLPSNPCASGIFFWFG